jgi:hypothetical protein
MIILAGKDNTGNLADYDAAEEDEQEKKEECDMVDIELWPEIKAMLVVELDMLFTRFPWLSQSQNTSTSLVHLASDIMMKSLDSYPLSAARLDEVTAIYHQHSKSVTVEASDLAKEIQEDALSSSALSSDEGIADLRQLESMVLQLSQVPNIDL